MKKISVLLLTIIVFFLPLYASEYTVALEKKIFALVNAERVKTGLQPLKPSKKLTLIARAHSLDMAARNFTGHINPDALDPTARAKKAGFNVKKDIPGGYRNGVGENIAMEQAQVEENGVVTGYLKPVEENAEKIVKGWMNSEGHRKNILNPGYTIVGTGASVAKDKKVRVTQVFF